MHQGLNTSHHARLFVGASEDLCCVTIVLNGTIKCGGNFLTLFLLRYKFVFEEETISIIKLLLIKHAAPTSFTLSLKNLCLGTLLPLGWTRCAFGPKSPSRTIPRIQSFCTLEPGCPWCGCKLVAANRNLSDSRYQRDLVASDNYRRSPTGLGPSICGSPLEHWCLLYCLSLAWGTNRSQRGSCSDSVPPFLFTWKVRGQPLVQKHYLTSLFCLTCQKGKQSTSRFAWA